MCKKDENLWRHRLRLTLKVFRANKILNPKVCSLIRHAFNLIKILNKISEDECAVFNFTVEGRILLATLNSAPEEFQKSRREFEARCLYNRQTEITLYYYRILKPEFLIKWKLAKYVPNKSVTD